MAKPVQTTLSDNIDSRLEALGLTARKASIMTGRGPDVIRNVKRAAEDGRNYAPRTDTLEALAQALETTADWLMKNHDGSMVAIETKSLSEQQNGSYRPPPTILGARDLKVFSSVEGGPGEMTVFSVDPLEIVARPWYVERDPEAYGIFLTGESMEPKYEAGQIIVVSPRSPLVKGKGFVVTAEPVGGDFRASLKLYRGQTETRWLAKQLNPEQDIEFDRDIWRKAYRVLGSFEG